MPKQRKVIPNVNAFQISFQPPKCLKLLKTLLKTRKTKGLDLIYRFKIVENSVESYKNSFLYQIQAVIFTLQFLIY